MQQCSWVDPILSLGSSPFGGSRIRTPTVCTSQMSWLPLRSWPRWSLAPRRSAGCHFPARSHLPAWRCRGAAPTRRCRQRGRSSCRTPASQSPPPCPSRSSLTWPCWPVPCGGCLWRRSPWSRRSSHRAVGRSTRCCGSSWCPYETSAWCPTGGNWLQRQRSNTGQGFIFLILQVAEFKVVSFLTGGLLVCARSLLDHHACYNSSGRHLFF